MLIVRVEMMQGSAIEEDERWQGMILGAEVQAQCENIRGDFRYGMVFVCI
jgi:hypothetical protein